MEDCQNEIANGRCPTCGSSGGYHTTFCFQKELSFAQLQGFPDYESYQRAVKAAFGDGKPDSLDSLCEQAQTLAARMGQTKTEYSGNWAELRAQVFAEKLLKELLAGVYKLSEEVRPTDPDGALTPLPVKPIPQRTVAAPSHDFIGALYKPYFSPI